MRTTLAIDDDVLAAARHLAAHQSKSVGEIISQLARTALTPRDKPSPARNGFPLLQRRAGKPSVTLELVNALRDEHGG
ncbi:MAG TPA: CopG family transcriptional regulator [Caulobacteraceae bacterium]